MPDQADQLRELVRQRAAGALAADPSLVVVAAARPGVGCTTVATALAQALAELNLRTIFVDADVVHGDASRRMQTSDTGTSGLAEVLSGRRTASEVLGFGPRGVRTLLVDPRATNGFTVSQTARDRLADELQRLGERAQALVLDTAGGLTPWMERFWQMARQVIVVTTPDHSAVAATYTLLLVAQAAGLLTPVRLVVNRCPSSSAADEVHQQLGQAIYRHCGELLPMLPAVPDFETISQCNHTSLPLAHAVMTEIGAEIQRGCNELRTIRSGAASCFPASGRYTQSGEKIKV